MKKEYTLSEVFSSPEFDSIFNEEVLELHNKRISILQKNPNLKLKASPYLNLRDKGLLGADYMKNEVLLIIAKKSTQSAANRQWIEDFMRDVVAQTLKALKPKEVPEKPKTKKANPKKKAVKKPSVKKQKSAKKL